MRTRDLHRAPVSSRRLMLLLLGVSAVAPAAAQDTRFFATKVYPILEEAQCRSCHAHDGVASGTRLHFPEQDAPASQIEAFGLALAGLVDRADPSKSLLLVKPTNRIAHTGGERVKPGSPEEKLIIQWANFLATAKTDASAPEKPTTTRAQPSQFVRRLTHSQYNNTVRDLLGDYSLPASRFPSEDYVDGFTNQLRMQGMPPLLVETYSTSAGKLALNAFRAGDVNHLIPCKPASAADIPCRDQFVRAFGLRAFRRPLRESEFQRYGAAFTAQARAPGKFEDGARTVVEAMLQSPKFLFHLEAGPDGRSTGYDIASRLSYLLWDTMPDQTLFDAAAKGELLTTSGRVNAARRMLDSPHAQQAMDEFFSQWLRFDRVLNATKEQRRYPEFSPEIAAEMVEETRRLLRHLVWSDANFMEFLTADYGFLSADLASLYKLPAPPGQFEMMRFPANANRAGLLGHGSFLASSAGPVETSPTARGIFVREQLLCQHVPPPPANVNTNLPEPTEAKPQTRRQRLGEHAGNPACASCHRLMDPIGFGLEGFDAIGRWREKELIQVASTGSRDKKIELPLETQGEIAGLPGSSFSEPKKLGRILAASPICQECIVRQFFRYAYGRLDGSSDQETIHQLFTKFRDSGFRFKELLLAIVASPEFLRGLDNNRTIGVRARR